MNEQERELDMLVAELEQENRLLRARNERLEAAEKDAFQSWVAQTKIEITNAILEERMSCAAIAREWIKAYPHPSQAIADRIMARGEA